MKLSVIDRLIITQSLLPESGTTSVIKLIISIRRKLGFSQEELDAFEITKPYNNILQINNVTDEMLLREIDYPLTSDEIALLNQLAVNNNANGWVTVSSLDIIEMLMDCKNE